MSEFIELLVSGESLATAIGELFKIAGAMALAIVLIVGLIFFLPTIIATLRHIKLRVFVCILNVLAIVTLFVQILLPIIVWLVIMILAISGKTESKNKNEIPSINIISK